jgi:hypothetical protein
MRKIFFILPIFMLLAACSQGAGGGFNQIPTPIRQSTGPFTLTISSPSDLAVVNQSQVNLKGEINKTAVLSINDDTYLLEKGAFSEPVTLQEGVNAVQIVASDMDGNEVDLILSITYQP